MLSRDDARQIAAAAAVCVDRSDLGVLKFSGETRSDLIHRMSTQDLRGLRSGEGRATVLTSDIGRIIDRLLIYVGSDAVYAVTGEGNADAIARYLLRFVFFRDDFRVENLTAQTAVWGVYGAQAAARLQAIGLPAAELPRHHWRRVQQDGRDLYLHRTDPVLGDGYFLMSDAAERDALGALLTAADIPAVDAETFDYLRIVSGLPRFGREITPQYIPLETGLWEDVSFSKGCYIGQEIIARMESRGKLAKRLVRLRGPAGTVPPAGADILHNGRAVGVLTSAAGDSEAVHALGYIKTQALEDPAAAFTAADVPFVVIP